VLCTAALMFAITGLKSESPRGVWRFSAAGACIAAVIFAKVQWVPLAFSILLVILLAITFLKASGSERIRRIIFLCVGGVGFIAFMLLAALISGNLLDFFDRYLLGQVSYANRNPIPLSAKLAIGLDILSYAHHASYGMTKWALILIFLFWPLTLLIISKMKSQNDKRRMNAVWRILVISTIGILGVAFLCVILSGNMYGHYSYLLIYATGLAFAVWLIFFLQMLRNKPLRFVMVLAFCLLPAIVAARESSVWIWNLESHMQLAQDCNGAKLNDQQRAIRALTKNGDSIAVWGWDYDIFVKTGRPNGTKTSSFLIYSGFGRPDFYMRSFIDELDAFRPALVVDAVVPHGFAFSNRIQHGVQTVPGLVEVLDKQYGKVIPIGDYLLWLNAHDIEQAGKSDTLSEIVAQTSQGNPAETIENYRRLIHRTYRLDDVVDFSASGQSNAYKVRGWSGSEGWGTWTEGEAARLELLLDIPAASDLMLMVEGNAYINAKHPQQRVEVRVNGELIETWIFQDGNDVREQRATVPAAVANRAKPMVVEFRLLEPMSPMALGLSGDYRILGLGFRRLVIGARGR
jgi:hypothetical protein